jgi:cytidylate kinase
VADNPRVRAHLVELQRREAAGRSIVTEGRDQGTVVFPSAECKIFLTATPSERARRRLLEMRDRGETADLEEVLQQIGDRDARDESRPVGRLLKAPDAVEVVTDGMCLERVVDTLEQLVRGKQGRP